MGWVHEGFPGPMPGLSDFYHLTNEQIGLTANLVTATNDVYQFALPFPSSTNLHTQTIIIWAIDFIFAAVDSHRDDLTDRLGIYISMLKKGFAATFRGGAVDAEDDNLKAQLDGPYSFGTRQTTTTDSGGITQQFFHDQIQNIRWFPVVPLRLLTPLYITLFNQSVTIDPATGDETAASYTSIENTVIKPWFTTSNLTPSEMQQRMSPTVRFQRLDS